MAGHIPKSFIDELLARVDIVPIISARLALRKAGANYVACCPFHDEKTPSFSVSSRKQFYYCFGCGASGNLLSFLMAYEHLTFVEAVTHLANEQGLSIPWEGGSQPTQKADYEPLYQVLEQAAHYYQDALKSHKGTQQYLHKRGISPAIAQTFRLGFAPPGWDNLLQHLHIDQEALKTWDLAGMLIAKDKGGYYERFRDRLMFPIINQSGRIIGFGGRVFNDDTPKYLNSPETPLFHKGRELYGLYQAQQISRELKRILVVEGYMDVIALHQYGITFSVATLGTAATRHHLERLFRYTDNVVFCFDGDKAGKNAAWRALQAALPVLEDGRSVRFVFLPEGEDPDSLVRREGSDPFNKRIDEATSLSVFFFNWLKADIDLSGLDGRARLGKQAQPLIEQIPPGFFKTMMQEELAKTTRINSTASFASPSPSSIPYSSPLKPKAATRLGPLKTVITLLLQNPTLIRFIEGDSLPTSIDVAGLDILHQLVKLIRQQADITTVELLNHWEDPKLKEYMAKLAFTDHLLDDDAMINEFTGALDRIHHFAMERQIEELLQKGEKLSHDEKQQLSQLIAKHQQKK